MSSSPAVPSAPSSHVVRWRFSAATVRSLRLLTYAVVGLTVGPVLGLVALVVATLLEGGVAVALLVVVLALFVGLGVGSGRALFALGHAPPEVHEDVRALSRWGVAGGVFVGLAVGLGGLLWTDSGLALIGGCVVAGVSALVVGAGLRTRGAVDTAERTVTYGGHTIPIAAIHRVHAVTVGPFVLALVAYHRGRVGPSTPRWLVCSVEAYDAIESVRAAMDEGDVEVSEAGGEPTTPRAVRWVAAAFGVGCLLSGPVLWLLLPPDGRLFAGYLGVFGLLFGALFVRYALVA